MSESVNSTVFSRNGVTVHHGDCMEVMRGMDECSVHAVVTDPPYGLEFMGKEWDRLGRQSGGGFSQPGIGDRPTQWTSFSSTSRFGAANPTCATCGGRLRGKKKCSCDEPVWKPIGKRRNPENEGLPDDMTGAGMGNQMQAMQQWHYEWAVAALRVLKPGGHLLAFGGTRTFHRLACALEDAGFEIRDCIMWVYGSGFPKSLNVSKAIDKAGGQPAPPNFAEWLKIERERKGLTAKELCERGKFYKKVNHGGLVSNWESGLGFPNAEQFNLLCDLLDLPFERREEAKREVLGWRQVAPGVAFSSDGPCKLPVTTPATEAAKQWEGYGTALKPSHEPVLVARKPLPGDTERRTIVENLIKLESLLWSILPANIAESHFQLSQVEQGEALASAQWTADEARSTWAALFGQMDTSQSVSVMATCLNTVTSWNSILVDAWNPANMSTIETVTSPTIDLRTLKSCVLALTPHTIIQAAIQRGGSWLNASPAARYLNAACLSISSTRELSALESAIDKGHISHPDAIDKDVLARPIIVARKPLMQTVAENVQQHGTGALNIDGCRITLNGDYKCGANGRPSQTGLGDNYDPAKANQHDEQGRWPANLIWSHHPECEYVGTEEIKGTSGGSESGKNAFGQDAGWNKHNNKPTPIERPETEKVEKRNCHSDCPSRLFPQTRSVLRLPAGDSGSAARFFYCAKASKSERNGSKHPTVKPVDLMRYLVRMVSPPEGGVILDPFAGSGTTAEACIREQVSGIAIEREAEYITDIQARISKSEFDQQRLF